MNETVNYDYVTTAFLTACNKFVKNGGSKETVDYLQNVLLPAIGKALGDDVIAYNVDMFPFVYANDDERQTTIQLILIGDIPSFYGDIFYNRFSQLNVDANNRVSLSSITDLNDSTVDSVALMYTSDKNAIYVNIAFKTRTITISLVK